MSDAVDGLRAMLSATEAEIAKLGDERDSLSDALAMREGAVAALTAENAALRAELQRRDEEAARTLDDDEKLDRARALMATHLTEAKAASVAQPQPPADERVLTVLREILAELVSQRPVIVPATGAAGYTPGPRQGVPK